LTEVNNQILKNFRPKYCLYYAGNSGYGKTALPFNKYSNKLYLISFDHH